MYLEGRKIQNQYTEITCILYTNNAKSEREIKESIPFTIATKRIKYLGRNLPKKTKELHIENYKTLMRVPWTARRSNQSILKEINPGISLEGKMLKLKLQYFGHLMRIVDSFEKTLRLGATGGRRRRG